MYSSKDPSSPDCTRYRSLSPGLLPIQPRRGWWWMMREFPSQSRKDRKGYVKEHKSSCTPPKENRPHRALRAERRMPTYNRVIQSSPNRWKQKSVFPHTLFGYGETRIPIISLSYQSSQTDLLPPTVPTGVSSSSSLRL